MNRTIVVAAGAAALTAALARPIPARACTCVEPGIEVLPRAGVAAPTNTRVRVMFPEYETWRDSVGARDADVIVGIQARIKVVAPAARGKGKGKGKGKKASAPARVTWTEKAVDVERADLVSGRLRIMELTPKVELSANTRYQVVMSVLGASQEVVGEFTTGDGPDTKAPTFEGISKARMQLDHDGDACNAGAPYARLVLGAVDDEGGPGTDALVYGLWTAGDDGKVAYDRPPATYLIARRGKLVVGLPSTCATSNYVFPKDLKSLILGIRAIDLAGNKAETAGEVVLDLSKVVENPKD